MNINRLSTPINKTAAVVVNQCRCANEDELNGLLEQQKILKENMRSLLAKPKSKERAALITQTNKDLQRLSSRLRPYREYHRKRTPKTREQALIMVIEHYLPKQVVNFIKREVKTLCGDET